MGYKPTKLPHNIKNRATNPRMLNTKRPILWYYTGKTGGVNRKNWDCGDIIVCRAILLARSYNIVPCMDKGLDQNLQ